MQRVIATGQQWFIYGCDKRTCHEWFAVTLYSHGWRTCVVEGKARNTSRLSVNVIIDLNEASRIYALGVLVNTVYQGGNILSINSLHAMQK